MVFGTLDFGSFHELYWIKSHRITIINFRAIDPLISRFAHVPLGIGFHLVYFEFYDWFRNYFGLFWDLFYNSFREFLNLVFINVLYVRIIKNLAHLLTTFIELSAQTMGILAILNSIVPSMAILVPSLFYGKGVSILIWVDYFAGTVRCSIVVEPISISLGISRRTIVIWGLLRTLNETRQ